MSSQVVEEQSRALQLDALRSSHPVEVPIRHAKADALGLPMGDMDRDGNGQPWRQH